MNTRILFAVALGLSTTAFAADRSFERTLSVSSAPVVSISTGSGFVHLHPGSDSQIHINAHLRPGQGWFDGASDAESRMDQIVKNPPIQQSGSSITIGERGRDNDLYRNIGIDYDITLPRASAITANSGSGEITIQDVGASAKAGTGSGNVNAHGIHGHVSLQTGSGDITLDAAGSDETRVQTGSGEIHLNGIAGELRAATGSGDMTITGNPTADWQLRTGSGSVHLNVGPSARFTLNATTGSGSVHIAQPMMVQGSLERHHVTGSVNGGGPILRAETGSGNIDIR